MNYSMDDFHDAREEQEEEQNEQNEYIYTCKSNEYIKYKKQLLGTLQPTKEDSKCEFYLLNNIENVKFFISNIKNFDFNYNLNKDHIDNIIRQVKNENEIYFTNPIALVEYDDYETNEHKNILEMIDGHHRIQSIQKLLIQEKLNIPVEIWIQIYKSGKPSSPDTINLFKKYNNTKPFPINRDLADFKFNLIEKINQTFKNKNGEVFELIRDSNRPRIRRDEFCKILENHIQKQYELTNRDLADVDIETLVKRFVNYNNTIMTKPHSWFNNKTSEHYNGKYITKDSFTNATENYKCLLCYIKLEYLIAQCIYI